MSSSDISLQDRILGGLWGAVVGDALGVPVEFRDRVSLEVSPVTDLREYGTHEQPKGTWSDDTSMSLCTVESLLHTEFDPEDMGSRFLQWMKKDLWTPHGRVFDIGIATRDALNKIAKGTPAEEAGGTTEYANGNGSLMRILPVALRFHNKTNAALSNRIHRASAITHRHLRSQIACTYYAIAVRELLRGSDREIAINEAGSTVRRLYNGNPELEHFNELLDGKLSTARMSAIRPSGYVVHTLVASVWCLLTTNSYTECVLKAVNLGDDTDTRACIAGGLAGLLYGVKSVPEEWRKCMSRAEELERLIGDFSKLIPNHTNGNESLT